ncbi:hypothetical protein L9F63_012207, partial [Diploptera punctata]
FYTLNTIIIRRIASFCSKWLPRHIPKSLTVYFVKVKRIYSKAVPVNTAKKKISHSPDEDETEAQIRDLSEQRKRRDYR